MANIPLGNSFWKRGVAEEVVIPLQNRYFEQNPTNQENQSALLIRPGFKRWLSVGSEPIAAIFSEQGAFNGDLFVVSGANLYRIDKNDNVSQLATGVFNLTKEYVNMTATARIGDTPENLFIADGEKLWVYVEGGALTQVTVPDGNGIVDVGFVAGFVICVVSEGFGNNGRFYWIEPGEITIDPLNFATAERAPDPLFAVRVVGDQFWLFGTNTTETWFPTGDPNVPFQRLQGRIFDRGIWEGTDVQVRNEVIVVDTDGVVYSMGDSPQRLSNNAIEEQIRKAMKTQRAAQN